MQKATRSAQELIKNLSQRHRMAAFVDLHSLWYYNQAQLYAFAGSVPSRQFGEDLVSAVEQCNGGNAWRGYGWIWLSLDRTSRTHSVYEPARCGSAKHWLVEQGIMHSRRPLLLTIETTHWKDPGGPAITENGLQGFGKGLGMVLTRFVRRANGRPSTAGNNT